MTTMKVRAVEGRKLPAVDGNGNPRQGRYVGYDRKGETIDPAGVTVPTDSYHLRAVRNGDLELVEGD